MDMTTLIIVFVVVVLGFVIIKKRGSKADTTKEFEGGGAPRESGKNQLK